MSHTHKQGSMPVKLPHLGHLSEVGALFSCKSPFYSVQNCVFGPLVARTCLNLTGLHCGVKKTFL